jgi:hypothetical protein
MRRALTGALATIVVALACALLSGCGSGDSDDPPSKDARARNAAKANCKGNECKVRFTCKGRVTIRRGAAPVRIHSSRSALVTTIIADFAGSRDDVVVRC